MPLQPAPTVAPDQPSRLTVNAVEDFFRRRAPELADAPGVVAFSGGADSCALLLACRDRQPATPLVAAHLDHGADPGSRDRARRAAALARRFGVPCVVHRRPVPELRRPGESPEAAARRLRYAFLARVARDAGAGWVATAHHADDQAETLLLRLAYGSGLRGLAGVRPAGPSPAGGPPLIRPLLELHRSDLEHAVREAGAEPVDDPTNRDLGVPRNRVRHRLLPHLARRAAGSGEPPPAEHLSALAATARRALASLDRRLADLLELRELGDGGADVDLAALRRLPAVLRRHALGLLHHRAGADYPAGREARAELERQLADGADPPGCDCGGGWRWQGRDDRLALLPPGAGSPAQEFSYILGVPGRVVIPEIRSVVQLYRAPLAQWMYRGAAHRAALALPLAAGDTVTVRSRRPGDRLRPLGAGGTRRLKDVLIDRRVPRRRRDRLPLLCLGAGGDDVVWVPGVTVAHRYRLPDRPPAGATVWVVEVSARGATPARATDRASDDDP